MPVSTGKKPPGKDSSDAGPPSSEPSGSPGATPRPSGSSEGGSGRAGGRQTKLNEFLVKDGPGKEAESSQGRRLGRRLRLLVDHSQRKA